MTNYKKIEDAIWNAAKSDNRSEFDKQCINLKERTKLDIWRIGWHFYPTTMEAVVDLMETAGKAVNKMWIDAMECGDAPHEDVSPGEGFQHCADLIRSEIQDKWVDRNEPCAIW